MSAATTKTSQPGTLAPTLSPALSPMALAIIIVLALVFIGLYIQFCLAVAPPRKPAMHFLERGFATALSAILLSMAGAIGLVNFYLRKSAGFVPATYWLAMGIGLLLLALDEQMMIHEWIGLVFNSKGMEAPSLVKNWNDVIVIGYGVVGLAFCIIFYREILRYRAYLVLLVIGFSFYVLHTAIDSLVVENTLQKIVTEEGAKITCNMFLLLANAVYLHALVQPLRRLKAV